MRKATPHNPRSAIAIPARNTKTPFARARALHEYTQTNRPQFFTHRHANKETNMNWDRIEGNWKQAKGKVKEQWGKLTDDELDKIAGKRDQLVGKIQNSYGIGKDEAEKQLNEWESRQRDVGETHDRPQ